MTDIKIHRSHIQNHSSQPKNKVVENTDKYIPDEIKDFAKKQEAVFSELMFKEMSKTTKNSMSGTAMDFYNSMLTTQRAEAMAEKSQNGIKDLILNEVYPKQYRNKRNFEAYQQQQNGFQKQKISMHDQPSQPAIEIANERTGVSHE